MLKLVVDVFLSAPYLLQRPCDLLVQFVKVTLINDKYGGDIKEFHKQWNQMLSLTSHFSHQFLLVQFVEVTLYKW